VATLGRGGVAPTPLCSEPMEPIEDVRLRTARGPLVFFALLVCAGVATGAWVLTRASIDPGRVLVVAHGCSQVCRESLVGRVGHYLEPHGLEVVPELGLVDGEEMPASYDDAQSLEEALEVAREVGAAHAVFVEVATQDVRGGVGGEGSTAALVEVHAHSATRQEGPRERMSIVLFREVRGEEDRALMESGVDGLDAFGDALAAEILASDAVRSFLEEEAAAHDLARHEALREAAEGLAARARGVSEFEQMCTRAAAEVREEGSELEVVCLTEGCAEEYVVGALPAGEGVLLRTETNSPTFPVGSATNVGAVEVPDRLVVAPFDAPRRTLVATQRLYGYGALSDDGDAAAFVETAGSTRALVWIDVNNGDREVLHRVTHPGLLNRAAISPDGLYVAFSERAYRRATAELRVVPVAGGEPYVATPYATAGTWVQLRLTPEGEPETLLAAVIPGERQETPPPEMLEDAEGAESDETPDETPDEEEGGDGEGEDALTFDDLMEAPPREIPDLPPLTHVALLRVGDDSAEVVTRIAGQERAVQLVLGARPRADGTPSTELVLGFRSRIYGCGFLRYDVATEEAAWVDTEECVGSPAVGDRARVLGHAPVTDEDDPAAGDNELVSVDLETGALTQLTRNAITDRYATPVARGRRVRVAFERQPRRRYQRHPVSAACWIELGPASTEPGEPTD